jgi:hypothetical protein
VIATLDHASRGGGLYPDLGLWHHVRFYAARLVAGTFPYALLYPLAVAGVLIGSREPEERARWMLVALYPAAVIAYFLSLSIYQPWYLIPALPFFSAFLGTWLDRLLRCPPARWTRIGLAVALAFGAWARLPVASVNPFAHRAMTARPDLHWGEVAGLGPALGIPLLAGVLWVAFSSLGDLRRRGSIATALVVALLCLGGIRVLAPLQYLSHASQSERLHRELAAALSEGRGIDYPVYVREPGLFKARYYFGDDFDLRPAGADLRREGVFFVLRERRNDAAARAGP